MCVTHVILLNLTFELTNYFKKRFLADCNNTVFKNLHATCYFVKVYEILIKRDELDKPSAHASFLATSYPGRARIKTLKYMGGMVKRNITFLQQVCLALCLYPSDGKKAYFSRGSRKILGF
jgi:hypothetical protein